MEKREIAQRVSKLQNKEDLLQLLNDIVKDELGSEHTFSFSLKQLTFSSTDGLSTGNERSRRISISFVFSLY